MSQLGSAYAFPVPVSADVPSSDAPASTPHASNELLGLGHALLEDIAANALTVVSVPGRGLGPQAASALSYAVSKSLVVHTLDVSANFLGDDGGRALAKALATCPSLVALDGSDNDLGPSGGIAIARGMRVAPRLAHLYLGFNSIDIGGAVALASATADSSTLLTLDVSFNSLGDDAVAAFASRLLTGCAERAGNGEPLPPLRLLQLDGNDVIHEGALACVWLLETLRGTLKTLSLTSNQLDDQAVLALIDASEKYDVRVLFNVGGADDFEWREGRTAFRESLAALNGRSLPGKRALSSAPPNEVLRANFCARTACPDTPISYENSDLFLNRNSS